MAGEWVKRPYKVLASCKATVRNLRTIYVGWPRNAFSVDPNVVWRHVVAVDSPAGVRWVLVGALRRPRVGSTVQLSTSPHTGAPLGYTTLEEVEKVAQVSGLTWATGFNVRHAAGAINGEG